MVTEARTEGLDVLTPRQLEIFRLMAKGLSNREICELLGISNNTVKIHVAAILRGLNVANRTEATFVYRELLETGASESGQRVRFLDRVGRPSVAILPLEVLAPPDNEFQYLVRGVEEELLARLAAWQWFPVVSLASSRHVAAQHNDPAAIGEALRARYLIGGALRHDGQRIRVTVHLYETEESAGQAVWSHVFELEMQELFSLQTEVAKLVVAALAPELIASEATLSRYRADADLTVWDNMCRGNWHMDRVTAPDVRRALTHFDRAIVQDEAFGLAYSGRVAALQMELYHQWAEQPVHNVAAVIANAETALRLEPRASYAHTSAAISHIHQGQQLQAIRHLEQAVALNPSSTTALNLLGQAYGMSGRLDDCIMLMEDLLRIDPHSSTAYNYYNVLGMTHFAAGRYDESLIACEAALAMNAASGGAYLAKIASYTAAGEAELAQRAKIALFEALPEFSAQTHLEMMRRFTRPELMEQLHNALSAAGLIK